MQEMDVVDVALDLQSIALLFTAPDDVPDDLVLPEEDNSFSV